MKLLVNDKELARYLISLIDLKDHCSHIKVNESNDSNLAAAMLFIVDKRDHHKFDLNKFRDKFKEKLNRAITADLKDWTNRVNETLSFYRNNHFTKIHKHLDYFITKLGEANIVENYLKSNQKYFIKTVGKQIDPSAEMIRRKYFNAIEEDCLLRNTVGNENILVEKIDNNFPFWFIDSGYSNFLEPNKKWHRLVRNHLHFNAYFVAPADRLSNFPSFPRPWNKNGKKILIVEPGQFAASIFHTEIKTWREQVVKELRMYTDRPIEFREKINKKTRKSLYKQLLDGDYYCTVSINSNSAIESIWAGVPAITLDKHVSNSVTRNSLSQINDLYYGPLGDWLAWLSYCQFTFDELMDGTAMEIVRKYHSA